MYVCSNCGTAFEGRVCPNCCTMRPAAAVLGNSGRILRSREIASVPPQQQAESLARELENARQAEEQRRQQQQHADDMRQRAAQLAQAAQRQEEHRQNYARQAEKAANWQRKAPLLRADLTEEAEVERPDALRSLKIRSAALTEPENTLAARKTGESKAAPKPAAPTRDYARRPSYPAAAQIPSKKGKRPAGAQVRSERIDAAWRYLAAGTEEGSDQ